MTSNTDKTIDLSFVVELVPPRFERVAPFVRSALERFIDALRDPRKRAVVESVQRAQTPMGRLLALVAQCPTLHKLGQVLGRDRRLDRSLRAGLQWLESIPAGMSHSQGQALVEALWPEAPFSVTGAGLAEGSVAVVLPVALDDVAHAGEGREAVAKVLKPGVAEALEEELAIWDRLVDLLADACEAHGIPAPDFRDALSRVGELLRAEIRLDREADHLVEAAAFYRDSRTLVVPEVLVGGHADMVVMERIDGVVLGQDESAGAGPALVETLLDAVLVQPFTSSRARPLFHADPHAGNVLVAGDRAVLLDWSMAFRLDVDERRRLALLAVGVVTRDPRLLAETLRELAISCTCPDRLDAAAGEALADTAGRDMLSLAMHVIDHVMARCGLTFHSHLLALRKAVLLLDGLAADVAPGLDIDAWCVSTASGLFMAEWPERMWLPWNVPASRTHLSSWDLACAGWNWQAGLCRSAL